MNDLSELDLLAARGCRFVRVYRAVIAAGGGEAEIRAASRWGFPWEIRSGVLSVWSGRGPGKPDAEIRLVA